MSILLGYLTLVASLSNREIDVSTPPAVPVTRPPLLIVPHWLHSPLVKVWPEEPALLPVQLPITDFTVIEVEVFAPGALPLPRSVLTRSLWTHPHPVVLQVLLLKVTIVPVTTRSSRIVEVAALWTLPIQSCPESHSQLIKVRLLEAAALVAFGPPPIVHVTASRAVPVSRHLLLWATLGDLLTSPDKLRPLLHVAIGAIAGKPPRKVHVATARAVPVPFVLRHTVVVGCGP